MTPMQSPEEWRPVTGYEDRYEVSNLGRVRSVDRVIYLSDGRRRDHRGRVLKAPINKVGGYPRLNLYDEDGVNPCLVHVLIAEHFVPNPDNLPEVNHKDLNKLNPIATNLEWTTRTGNVRHYRENGRGTFKLTKAQVLDIRSRRKRGDLLIDIAIDFGVRESTVSRIATGVRRQTVVAV